MICSPHFPVICRPPLHVLLTRGNSNLDALRAHAPTRTSPCSFSRLDHRRRGGERERERESDRESSLSDLRSRLALAGGLRLLERDE